MKMQVDDQLEKIRRQPNISNNLDFLKLDDQQQKQILSSVISMLHSQNAKHGTQLKDENATSNDEQFPNN